jgi:hypothetical protein
VDAVYRTDLAETPLFADADAQYTAMKETLTSEDFQGKTEAEVQRWLAVEQRELMRRLFQSHITLRGQAQAQEPVVGADGVPRTHLRHEKSRKLESLFGTVEVERTGHSGRGLSTLYPVDASLNLPGTRYSQEVDRQVALLAARLSFDEALEMVGSLTGAHVPKRQAEEAVQRAARDFGTFYSGTQIEFEGSTSELLVLTFDQKGVVLHKEDLAEATRKAAESSRYKMDTRLSQGEKRGRKRMATVAAVYTVAPYLRTAQEVIAGLRHVRDATPKPRPHPEGKRVWASLTRNLKDVIADAFDEACDRDPERSKRWLVLVDGDKKLTRWVRAEARRRGVEITLVLDFIHALEYLWKAAHVFFDRGTPEIEAWVLERLERMLEGGISHVVAGMTRMATVRGLSKKERMPVDKAAKYLLQRVRWGMMCYDELLAIGAPIATGIIEGACRHLINDRMDLTGARWRLPSAEAVLRVRSILSSGDFYEYWRFHEEAEARRNHASHYADEKVPPVERPTRTAQLIVVRSVD